MPHVTDEIINWITINANVIVDNSSNKIPDICLIEIGGTVGDLEAGIYHEAIRQLFQTIEDNDKCLFAVSYIPCIQDEQKTKLTQKGFKEILFTGLLPDFLIVRSEKEINEYIKNKICLFCNVSCDHIISIPNLSTVLKIPQKLEEQNLSKLLLKKLG